MATARFTARNKAHAQTLKGTQETREFPSSLARRGMGLPARQKILRRRCAMRKLVLLTAAAAFVAPALIASASAETVNVRVGSPGYRAYSQERVVVSPHHCRTVTVRSRHANGTVVIRKHRRCG